MNGYKSTPYPSQPIQLRTRRGDGRADNGGSYTPTAEETDIEPMTATDMAVLLSLITASGFVSVGCIDWILSNVIFKLWSVV